MKEIRAPTVIAFFILVIPSGSLKCVLCSNVSSAYIYFYFWHFNRYKYGNPQRVRELADL